MVYSLAGLAFAVFTVANLAPRHTKSINTIVINLMINQKIGRLFFLVFGKNIYLCI